MEFSDEVQDEEEEGQYPTNTQYEIYDSNAGDSNQGVEYKGSQS